MCISQPRASAKAGRSLRLIACIALAISLPGRHCFAFAMRQGLRQGNVRGRQPDTRRPDPRSFPFPQTPPIDAKNSPQGRHRRRRRKNRDIRFRNDLYLQGRDHPGRTQGVYPGAFATASHFPGSSQMSIRILPGRRSRSRAANRPSTSRCAANRSNRHLPGDRFLRSASEPGAPMEDKGRPVAAHLNRLKAEMPRFFPPSLTGRLLRPCPSEKSWTGLTPCGRCEAIDDC